jgi:hypothetical protein
MRRTNLQTFAWLAAACFPFLAQADSTRDQGSTSEPLKVLFIGNSYTYVNSLPNMLAMLTTSIGSPRPIQTKTVAMPAATLQMLWEKGTAKEAIQERKWDFVVLQEQSVRPTEDPERMYYYARQFDAEIKKNGARTILFLTWAPRGNPERQLPLDRAYFTLAKELDAQVAPVGPAWRVALGIAPTIALHMDDGSHPTPTGSYLAACVFYHVILDNKQPCPTIERAEISQEDATVARNAASQAWTAVR